MTRGGRAYELQTLARHIDANEYSSWPTGQKAERSLKLLPTPVASDKRGGQLVSRRQAGGHQVQLTDLMVTLFPSPSGTPRLQLLPTPIASDGTKGQTGYRSRQGGLSLPRTVIALMEERLAA